MAGSSRRSGLARRARSASPLPPEPAAAQQEVEEQERDEAVTPEAVTPEAARAEAVSARALGGAVPGSADEPPRWEETVGNRLSQVLVWLTGLLMVTAVVVIVIEIIYRYILREPFESSQDVQGVLFT